MCPHQNSIEIVGVPIIEAGNEIIVGFHENRRSELLGL